MPQPSYSRRGGVDLFIINFGSDSLYPACFAESRASRTSPSFPPEGHFYHRTIEILAEMLRAWPAGDSPKPDRTVYSIGPDAVFSALRELLPRNDLMGARLKRSRPAAITCYD